MLWTKCQSRSGVKNWACGQRCSTAGRRNCSRADRRFSVSGTSPPPSVQELDPFLLLLHAERLIQPYVDRYNYLRLHSAIGYVTPNDMLAGRQVEIHAERDRKLEAARQQCQSRRQQAA